MRDGHLPLSVDRERLAAFCRRHRIRTLEIFGSALREDFGPASDIDLLVEFEPDAEVDIVEYCGIQRQLADLLGRKVDLVPKPGLKPLIRDEVLSSARLLYGAA